MTPEELFTETFRNIVNGWAIVTSLRQFSELSMPTALVAMEQQSMAAAEYMIQERMIVPIEGHPLAADGNTKQLLSRLMADQSKANVVWAIDAASVIFMHSMLDDVLASLCEVAALQSPSDWENEVEQKGFELKQIKQKTYSDLFKEALRKRLNRLKNDSVIDKCDLLHRLCKPPAHFTPIKGHAFDVTRLESIDQKRHNIVHSGTLGQQLGDVEGDLQYLRDTANYFWALINHKYGLRLSIAAMIMPRTEASE